MKRYLVFFGALIVCLCLQAQELSPVSWTAYGLTFKAPKGIIIEEDTEDTFLLNNNRFYIVLQILESDDLNEDGVDELLKGLADDEGVEDLSPVKTFDLPQFHVSYLKGKIEDERCCCACLMTKDAGNIFYVSIAYNKLEDSIPLKMLESFVMEE